MKQANIILICAIAIALGLAVWIRFAGSVVVLDPVGVAQSVLVIDGWGNTQRLSPVLRAHLLLGPEIEGHVRVRCHDGRVVDGGYVTPHLHLRLTLDGSGRCYFSKLRSD